MRRLLGLVATGIVGLMLVGACGKKEEHKEYKDYTLNGVFNDGLDSLPVYLISLSTGDTLAFDTIRNNSVELKGKVATPDLVQLMMGNIPSVNMVLEPGVIYYSIDSIGGTPLNEVFNSYQKFGSQILDSLTAIQQDSLLTDSVKNVKLRDITAVYANYRDSIKSSNLDNPIGASLLIQDAPNMTPVELEMIMNAHPSLKSYAWLYHILDQKQQKR